MNWHKLRVGQLDAPTVRLIRKASRRETGWLESCEEAATVPENEVLERREREKKYNTTTPVLHSRQQQPTFIAVFFLFFIMVLLWLLKIFAYFDN